MTAIKLLFKNNSCLIEKKINFSILFSILFTFGLSLQYTPAQAPDIEWEKGYQYLEEAHTSPYSIQITNDGGFIICGELWHDYFSYSFILKTDKIGNTEIFNYYSNGYSSVFRSIEQIFDGSYIATGFDKQNQGSFSKVSLKKISQTGALIWQKLYESPGTGSSGREIHYDKDSGFVIVGYTGNDVLLMKTDADGDTLWKHQYNGGGAEIGDSFKITAADNGYIIAGSSDAFGAARDIWLIKTDSIGQKIWDTNIGGSGNQGSSYVIISNDGGYVISGYTPDTSGSVDIYVVKVSSDGVFQWAKAYGTPDLEYSGSIEQTADGGYIVGGFTAINGTSTSGLYIVRTDSIGEVLWTKTIFADNSSWGSRVLQTEDLGYIILGEMVNNGTWVWLLKLAPDLIIPVDLTTFTASVNGNNVNLNWQTATELNNRGFEVERATVNENKRSDWSVVKFVPGAGSTTNPMTYQFIDTKMNTGSYVYRLKQIDYDGSFEYSYEVEALISSPVDYSLSQNYPNPFNPTTSISYSIPENAFVTLKIYGVLGNEVEVLINEQKAPGDYQIDFNASELSSGIYYYKLTAGNFTSTKKMSLVK